LWQLRHGGGDGGFSWLVLGPASQALPPDCIWCGLCGPKMLVKFVMCGRIGPCVDLALLFNHFLLLHLHRPAEYCEKLVASLAATTPYSERPWQLHYRLHVIIVRIPFMVAHYNREISDYSFCFSSSVTTSESEFKSDVSSAVESGTSNEGSEGGEAMSATGVIAQDPTVGSETSEISCDDWMQIGATISTTQGKVAMPAATNRWLEDILIGRMDKGYSEEQAIEDMRTRMRPFVNPACPLDTILRRVALSPFVRLL